MAYYFRIDHELRLLAVFSPKCASNSIHRWMDRLARASGQGADFDRKNACWINPNQLGEYKDYTCVQFLRDPLRRLASFYSQWVVRRPGDWSNADHDQRFQLHRKSFREFLYIIDHLFRHDLPFQHHLEMQTRNVPEFEFLHVVLIEGLSKELQALNSRLCYSDSVGNENRTDKSDLLQAFVGDTKPAWLARNGVPEYQWFYDHDMAEIARRIYAQDVDYYRAHGGRILDSVENS
jgi:hypothetical protein